MAVIAIEFLSVHRRNVGRKMALMIKAQQVGIARVLAFQLEFGVRFPEVRKSGCVPLRRPRQF